LLMGAAVAAWVTSESSQAASQPPAESSEAAAPAPKPEVRVVPEAERLAAVTKFIESRRVAGEMELNVERGAAGAIRIFGAAANPAQVAELVAAANAELADAAPLEFA